MYKVILGWMDRLLFCISSLHLYEDLLRCPVNIVLEPEVWQCCAACAVLHWLGEEHVPVRFSGAGDGVGCVVDPDNIGTYLLCSSVYSFGFPG
jgi:hypothetical protein